MDIKAYIIPLLKWWWLLTIAIVVSAVSAFVVTLNQPPIYQASTTLVIGRALYELNPSGIDMYLGQQLASYYADLAGREKVRRETMAVLGINRLPAYVSRPLPNSQFIEIVVTDVLPERAMIVANELANQLIKQTPANAGNENQFVAEQIAKLEVAIRQTEEERNQKESELLELNSARQIIDKEAEIATLEEKLTRMQSTYANLIGNTDQGALNTLSVIEEASLPQIPVGPNKFITIMLSAAVGFLIAAGAAYLLEFLDNSIKTSEEVERYLHLPVIGLIPEITKEVNETAYVGKYPSSPVAEAFRSLRTNVDFLGFEKPLKTILISSTDMGEGKSFIAINLAISMSHSGKKTLLVDADLHNPSIHRFLDLENNVGLSDLFRGTKNVQDILQTLENESLLVITSGEKPPNPTELLGSKRMNEILETLSQEAEVVIVDGPPFIVSDAALLSSKTHGVIFVIRSGSVPRKRIHSAIDYLHRAHGKIVGVTLNMLPRSHVDIYTYRYERKSEQTGSGTTFKQILKRLGIGEKIRKQNNVISER